MNQEATEQLACRRVPYNMKVNKLLLLGAIITIGLMLGCNGPQPKQPPKAPTPLPKPQDTTTKKTTPPDTAQTILTLPALDALFYEPGFAASLRSQLGLTIVQIQKLKAAAHASLADLSEGGAADTASARTATQRYQAQITTIIGANKTQQLLQLVTERASEGVAGLAPSQPNFVPTDTRIVVNAPAFRMDVFQNGRLLKSYRVGIGYPEFPLPAGMRRADTIIFNPSWTPPDEPWVKGKFHAGRKVLATSELNPLGRIKIPIGMPSLIHGGKPPGKIGNFASHGCVGLTNSEVLDFAPILARLGGSGLTDGDIQRLEMHKTQTRFVKLPNPVPVDLRYETIVAENDSLHIYRDVYERGTNTLTAAKRVLAVYGVKYSQLSDQEKSDLDTALKEMNRDAHGNAIATDSIPPPVRGVPASKLARSKKGKVTAKINGETEAVLPIAALAGKGYPEPVNLVTGKAMAGHHRSVKKLHKRIHHRRHRK